jgi:transposase
MGYRFMTIDDLKEILRRWHSGHSLSSLKKALGFDRNTIRNYIRLFLASGLLPERPLPEDQALIMALQAMLPLKARSRDIRGIFEAHKDEILTLVTRKEEPVKPKTAFQIIKSKYDIEGSYETFKLFMREHAPAIEKPAAPLRIELPAGEETQLDYGKVGTIHDQATGRNRVVWAFCARLSCSRLPYIEFVYTQDRESFVESNIGMVEFYGGVTRFISIDNLKAGVDKPDLYDPRINRAYAEFAEHYGTFINPCRVATPTDKAKVERLVPQARELFRRLKAVHPTFNLAELNGAARDWCLLEYGMANHGTTHRKPKEVFEETEKAALLPLPQTRFEVPVWKTPTVGADRFFAFDKRHYAMPMNYRFEKIRVRKTGKILRIFDMNHTFIREYIISGSLFNSLPGDFPQDREAMMKGEYPLWLIGRARSFGTGTVKLVEAILSPHAYINSRRARGIINVLEKYRDHPFREEICAKAATHRVFTPKQLVQMLETEKLQGHFEFILPMSDACKAMTRDVKEYFN